MEDIQTVRVGYVHSAPLLNPATSQAISAVDVEKEVEALRNVFKESGQKIRFRQEVATVPNFGNLLAKGCTLLHYTGHGLESGDLAFENEQGELHPLRTKNLRELLIGGDGETIRTKVAFVSACHSQEAGRAFVAAGVPHVVAVRLDSKVLDKAAISFSTVFYSTLLGGATVRHAFDFADRTVRAASQGPHLAGSEFLLLPQDSNVHEVTLFKKVDFVPYTRVFQDETAPTPHNSCNFPPRPFIGRHVEMHKAYRYFVEGHRCVSITGTSGIGKSALACRVAHHLAQRHMFCRVICCDLSPDSETISQVTQTFHSRHLSDVEIVRRSLAVVLEHALASGSANSGGSPEIWCRETHQPLPTELLDLVERIVKTSSATLMKSPLRTSSDPSVSSILDSIEDEAANIHEVWRTARRKDTEANKKREPCWRKIDASEVSSWLAQLPPGMSERIYLQAPAMASNPSVPDQSPPDDQSWLEVPRREPNNIHWVDIDIAYELLPESWKERNRMYVPPRGRASSSAVSENQSGDQNTSSGLPPAPASWSPHCPPPSPMLSVTGERSDDGVMSAPLKPLLLVIDGADSKRSAVVDILNKLFHKCQLLRVLSTCTQGLTGGHHHHSGADLVASSLIALDAEPEKQIRVEKLRGVEAAELLIHSSPRNLMLAEMGLSKPGAWDASMHLLSQRPALAALNGHPRAIRHFAPLLGVVSAKSASGGSGGGGGGVPYSLDDLVEAAHRCYLDATAPKHTNLANQHAFSAEVATAFSLLKDDILSLNLWKDVTSMMKGLPHEQKVTWQGSTGLAAALEKDLNEASARGGSGHTNGLAWRSLGASDVVFLQSIMSAQTLGETKDKDDITYPNFVAFSKWWRRVRDVVTWLGADFRGGRLNQTNGVPPMLIHGFLDRKQANRLLKHKGLGAFLLRFSERQPDKLVIVFNEQLDPPATHCLVDVIDNSISNLNGFGQSGDGVSSIKGSSTTNRCCCISFEGGARQEYATLGDLVLDCRRLSHSPDGTPKSALFKKSSSAQAQLPEPLGGMMSNQSTRPQNQGIDPLQ